MKAGYYWPVYGELDEVCFAYFDPRQHRNVIELLGDKPVEGAVLLSDGYAPNSAPRPPSCGCTACWPTGTN